MITGSRRLIRRLIRFRNLSPINLESSCSTPGKLPDSSPTRIILGMISGNISAVIICRFKEMREFQEFTNTLNEEEDIQMVDSNIVLDIFKEDLHHLLSSENKSGEKE